MKKVLLYSGGLDSELYRFLLKPEILLFINYSGKYSEIEKNQVLNNTYSDQEKLVIDTSFNFSVTEREDHIIPMRNVYFLLKALEYGDTAILGVTLYDIHRDQALDVLYSIQTMVRNYHQPVGRHEMWSTDVPNVLAPYSNYTKGELLSMCLELGADPLFFQNIRTCYSPTSIKGCGKCKSCFQKALALADNDLFKIELFDTDPRKAVNLVNDYLVASAGQIEQTIFLDNLKKLNNA